MARAVANLFERLQIRLADRKSLRTTANPAGRSQISFNSWSVLVLVAFRLRKAGIQVLN